VLKGRHIGDYDNWTVNNDLRNALKSRATEDTIQLVHLKVEESRYNLRINHQGRGASIQQYGVIGFVELGLHRSGGRL